MKINRILIVGYGSIGKRHYSIIRRLLPESIVKILRHNENQLITTDDNFVYSIDDALAFLPQIAVIASPSPFHIYIAQTLAENKVHLLVEKPLSNKCSGVNRLIKTCLKNKLILSVGFNLRFLPSLQYFRNAIIASLVGRVLSVRSEVGQYLPSWRSEIDYKDSVSAQKKLGGGVLLELSHELDYLRWIFGDVEWVTASLSKQSNLDIDVEDTAHLVIGFAKTKSNHNIIGNLNMDFIRHDSTRKCFAIGEKSTLMWDAAAGEVNLYEPDKKKWLNLFKDKINLEESYLEEWKDFLSCINLNKKPFVSGRDGLKVIEIIEAARLSAHENSKIFLDSQ